MYKKAKQVVMAMASLAIAGGVPASLLGLPSSAKAKGRMLNDADVQRLNAAEAKRARRAQKRMGADRGGC